MSHEDNSLPAETAQCLRDRAMRVRAYERKLLAADQARDRLILYAEELEVQAAALEAPSREV